MEKIHQHLIFNGIVKNVYRDPKPCRKWLNKLIPKINMKTLVPAKTTWCAEPGNEGITGIVVITTSHAAFHYWDPMSDQPGRLSFCLYSCAPFKSECVIDHIDEFWKIEKCNFKMFNRNWEITEIDDQTSLYTDSIANNQQEDEMVLCS